MALMLCRMEELLFLKDLRALSSQLMQILQFQVLCRKCKRIAHPCPFQHFRPHLSIYLMATVPRCGGTFFIYRDVKNPLRSNQQFSLMIIQSHDLTLALVGLSAIADEIPGKAIELLAKIRGAVVNMSRKVLFS